MTEKPSDSTRRKVLKLVGATGLTAAGAGAVSGTAAAAPGGSGSITQQDGNSTQDIKTSLIDESGNKVGTFEGTLSLTELGYDAAEETFTSTGTLDGTVKSQSTTQQVTQAFEDTPTQLQANGGCTILTLVLGPLEPRSVGTSRPTKPYQPSNYRRDRVGEPAGEPPVRYR